MLTCPWCKKTTPARERECASCHADLTLLVDYVENLAGGLVKAEELTRAGQLGEAVWAYLEVLEVDPDNAVARRQVGRVATAVRQFDLAAPSRRWVRQLRRRSRFRRWLAAWNEGDSSWSSVLWLLLVLAALALGFVMGQHVQRASPPPAEVSSR
jgi:hypothetical protein